ncbi:hypothetical protein M9H77_11263 [Catharanthus roseus]|uniref:Uncharacterized protein n=1 Tax=Catharanthus roseus TaxID=4058 RepID=A0ACC0BE47_CATRO|nr:hypothetical protein M9H77_11263 [Catharanthus roseus]
MLTSSLLLVALLVLSCCLLPHLVAASPAAVGVACEPPLDLLHLRSNFRQASSVLLPEKKKKEGLSAEEEDEGSNCNFIRTTVISEPENNFKFPVLLWTGGWTSRITPDFNIPNSQSPWIWLREASSKPSLFISVVAQPLPIYFSVSPLITLICPFNHVSSKN